MNSNGTVDVTTMSLDSEGDGTQTVSFSPSTVDRVILIASNASTNYENCGGFSSYSCGGKPKFDDQEFVVKGTL